MFAKRKCPHCGRMVLPLIVPAGALRITIGGIRPMVEDPVPVCPSCGVYMLVGEEERQFLRKYSERAKLAQETPDVQNTQPDPEGT